MEWLKVLLFKNCLMKRIKHLIFVLLHYACIWLRFAAFCIIWGHVAAFCSDLLLIF